MRSTSSSAIARDSCPHLPVVPAMTDVFSLLSLPSASSAFSAFSSPSQDVASTRDETSRSASPPRKIARLDVASDAHAASSPSSRLDVSAPSDRRGSIIIHIVGHPSMFTIPTHTSDSETKL